MQNFNPKKYTSRKKIIAYGGSAGGLLVSNVVNQEPNIFLGAIMAVPFVDNLTTNMDHSLPLTPGEILEFGDAKIIKNILNIFVLTPHMIILKKKIIQIF